MDLQFLGKGHGRVRISCKLILFAALFLFAFPFTSFADPAASDSYATPPQLTQRASSDAAGAYNFEFPIVTPPGRGKMTPDLKLVYNSNAADNNSAFGHGWNLNLPYIERINRTGINNIGTDNYYSSAVDGELASTTSSTTYGARIENGNFTKYVLSTSTDTWTATDKFGTTYLFGTTSASKDSQLSGPDFTYRWYIQEIRDRNDNYIKFEYYKDGTTYRDVYISSIKYSGNGTTDGPFTVNFLRESRNDNATSYKTGFAVTTNYRIYEIDVLVSGTWVKKYNLAYTTGDNGKRSLLSSVTEQGRDESGATITLPATTFGYSTVSASSWSNIPWNGGAADAGSGDSYLDINGDALIDFVSAKPASYYAYVNNGSTFVLQSSFVVPGYINYTTDDGYRFSDVNADGLVDILYSFNNNGTASSTVYINTGTNWVASSTWAGRIPVDFVYYNANGGTRTTCSVSLVDVNGDGILDILSTGGGSCSSSGTFLGNGKNGWQSAAKWQGGGASGDGLNYLDVSGDGLVDRIISSQTTKLVEINNGKDGWVENVTWGASLPGPINQGSHDLGYRFGEFNGDGLIDIIYAWNNVGVGTSTIYYNDGSRWVYSQAASGTIPVGNSFIFTPASGPTVNGGTIVVDINADGISDLMHSGTGGSDATYAKVGPVADILRTVHNWKGGTTTINYRPSTQSKSGTANGNPRLPFIIQTVSSLVGNDGVGNVATTTEYAYAGGAFFYENSYNRKFAGYATTTITDGLGNVTKSYFHQGDSTDSSGGEYSDAEAKVGKPYKVEKYNGSNTLYQKTINKWDKYDLATATPRWFVKNVQTIDFSYDGLGTHKDKAEAYTYDDANGNLQQRITWGEVTGADAGTFTDVGTDNASTTITYAASSTPHILGFPSQETTVDNALNKVKENRYYYDSLALGSVDKGNLTKLEQWISGTTYASSTKTYNSYGLVTTDTDPRAKTTSFTYDSLNLYPATSTNPLGHVTHFYYDYSLGKPKETIDPNGLSAQVVYDALDRVKEEKQPDLTTPSTLVTKNLYTYFDSIVPTATKKTSYLNSATTTDFYTHFDGFGRKIQERKQTEESNVFSTKDYVYNNAGLLNKETLLYFSTGTTSTAIASSSSLFTTYLYDPLHRILTTTNAVATTTTAYTNWKTTVTDGNGKIKDFYSDAYGNLSQVDERNATSTYSTVYTYDRANNLTKITDALANFRNFTYDGLKRRLTAEDLHVSGDTYFGTWTYTYDLSGNVTAILDPKSQTINRTYDDINRILTEDYTGLSGTEMSYAYDVCTYGKGRLCSATTTSAVTSYLYNSLGLPSQETKTIDSINYVTGYSYDRQGNLSNVTYPDSLQVAYTYNDAGLVEKVARKASGEASFTNVITETNYSPMGQVIYRLWGNGATTTNTYDSTKLYRLTRKITSGVSTTTSAGGGGGGLAMLSGFGKYYAKSTARLPLAVELPEDLIESLTKELGTSTEEVPFDNSVTVATTTVTEATSVTLPAPVTETVIATSTEATSTPALLISEEILVSTSTEPTSTTTPLFLELEQSTSTVSIAIAIEETATTTSTTTAEFLAEDFSSASSTLALLLDKTSKEKANIKGRAIAKRGERGQYVVGDLRIDIVKIEEIEGGVQVFAKAWKGGKQLGFGKDGSVEIERFRIFNPPILVRDDERGEIEREYTLEGLDGVDVTTRYKLRYDPAAALKEDLAHTIGLIGKENTRIIPGKVGNTASTFYPDAGTSGTTFDGSIQAQKEGWSATHSTTDVYTSSTADYGEWCGFASSRGGGLYTISRANYFFDTSPIDVDVVTSATFSLKNVGSVTNGDSTRVSVVHPTFPSNTNFSAGDLQQFGTTEAASITISNWSTTDYNNFSLNATGLGWIVKTGVTQLGTRLGLDIDNTTPGGENRLASYFADQTGSTQDPKLVIEHTTYVISQTNNVQDLIYEYDAVGNITKIVNNAGNNAAGEYRYTYDDLHRMTKARTVGSVTGDNYVKMYDYDALGSIASTTDQKAFSYQGNQGTSYANPHAVTGLQGVTFTYDNNGNLTSNGTTTFAFDYRNRLGTTTHNSLTETYFYDHTEQRVKFLTSTTTNLYPNKYYSVATTSGGIGTTTKHIFVGDEAIATVVGTSTIYYLHTDHLGSTQVVSNGNGGSSEVLDYYPYGGTRMDLKSSSGFDEDRTYIGQYFDDETALSYLNARYYNPAQGQFVSQDPVFWEVGMTQDGRSMLLDPQLQNSYSYARSNPIIHKDPDGRIIPLAAAAALFALNIYDTYDTTKTILDPNTNVGSKVVAAGLWASPLGEAKAGVSGISKAAQLVKNIAQGKAFEGAAFKEFEKAVADATQQITVQTQSGIKTRLDMLGRNSNGSVCLVECKSSASAPLTSNQSKAFPEIKNSGATVVGKGKPGFPGGTKISPTAVQIKRP